MLRHLAVATLAIFAAALTVTGPAEARGGRVTLGNADNAPSKYSRSHQDANQNQQATRSDFPITEYSSSSARNRSH